MQSQGIKGLTYRFIHGSTKEILSMKEEAIANPTAYDMPKELSSIVWICSLDQLSNFEVISLNIQLDLLIMFPISKLLYAIIRSDRFYSNLI